MANGFSDASSGLVDFFNRSVDSLTAGFNAGKKKFKRGKRGRRGPRGQAGDAGEVEEVEEVEVARPEDNYYETEAGSDERKQRIALRNQITDAFQIQNEDIRRASLNELANKGVNEMGIAPELFEREVQEADAENTAAMAEQKRKDDYNRFFESRSRTLGVGQKRQLYSRRKKMRIADQLRKKGYGKAAEQLALDYGRSAEASAPAISTPAMRQRRMADRAEADEVRQMNQGLTRLLIKKTEQQLRDPDFKLNLNF